MNADTHPPQFGIPGTEGALRLSPRIWDYSYSLLWRLARSFRQALEHENARAPIAGETAIDFGCGSRPYEALFRRFQCRYIGVDIESNPKADVRIVPGAPLPLPDGSARFVLSTQVLEHVFDVDGYLRECRRLLAQDGLLLLSTHGFWTYHGYPDDFRRWTRRGLVLEVESRGFTVEKVTPCLGLLAYTTHVRTQLLRGLLYRLHPAAARALCPVLHTLSALVIELEEFITPRWVTADNAAVYVLAARRS